MAYAARYCNANVPGRYANRPIFDKRNENRTEVRGEEVMYQAVFSIFNLRTASLLLFDNIYQELKNYGPAWRYIGGDRKKLRLFFEYYNKNFQFIDGFLYVSLTPEKTLSSTYNDRAEFEIIQKEKETMKKEKREKFYSKYDVVFEFDTLNCVLAIFLQSGRNKLQLDFIDNVLRQKFQTAEEYCDLVDYLGGGNAVISFLSRRYYLFAKEGNYFTIRSKVYFDVVYKLNEFLRDDGDRKWKHVESLIDFYLNKISQQDRCEMGLTSRELFLDFLQLNNFVFDIRLEEDYEVSSNIPLPSLKWESVKKNRSLICFNFDQLLKNYVEKEELKKNAFPNAMETDEDEYFEYSFNPANGLYDDDDEEQQRGNGENLL